ncbi:anthranilate synthase component 1 [Pseudofrancisella aestuarii]|uniref:Anthranilate synthase component 1 n=1 Tax=Pseudofrancisella aestuarii TaxID=2670347 RepID=A0ABV9TDE4_9GAMM|nr:anthranilate synthase component 1 [Pseudofrancisella aestuarii]
MFKFEKKYLNSKVYNIDYSADLNDVFYKVCNSKKNTILLESAEISTKDKLKSILVVDNAVRISCIGNKVIFKALSKNGEFLLKSLEFNISKNIKYKLDKEELVLEFAKNNSKLDEYSKLKEQSVFDALRLVRDSFELTNEYSVFLAGLFAYDLVGTFEDINKVERKNKCPDYIFYVAETLLVTDHQKKESFIQTNLFNRNIEKTIEDRVDLLKIDLNKKIEEEKVNKIKNLDVSISLSDKEYCQIVDKLKTNIINGDIFQIVPSRSFYLPCQNSLSVYKELKRTNPSPYMFYMQDEDFILFGASPESAVKYTKDTNQVEVYPIAGTRRRGKNLDGSINLDLDSRIELELRLDAKENAEHMMLVDLARNDVARISKTGTRHVADLLKVDRYSHVMHLVSRVVGQLADDLDALHAYQVNMNMGTLTGAPKIKAMQLISDVEKKTRGSYGGAIGYINGFGDLDSCIVIRSAYVENEIAEIQAGGGVVLDSIPIAEADETRTKAQAVISAIKNVHGE